MVPNDIDDFKTEPNTRYYFAYGSNMDTAQMSDRCSGAEFICRAKLSGYRFIINGPGVATIVPDRFCTVHGILWALTRADENALDDYEGVDEGLYVKVRTTVETSEGSPVSALVYVAQEKTKGLPRVGYMERIVSAAESHGLPAAYVEELRPWLQKGKKTKPNATA
jgi:gamma-glutamylcyclotransferase (GGCT)/AIG2-like uncharacterized protein YtfP